MSTFQQKATSLRNLSIEYGQRASQARRNGNEEAYQRLSRLSAQCSLEIQILDYKERFGEQMTIDFLSRLVVNIQHSSL